MRFQERQTTKNHSDPTRKPPESVCLLSSILTVKWSAVFVTSSFSDCIFFAVHIRKKSFSNSTVFKSFHSGERFRIDPFSLIVFFVVVWTVAVSGTKQYRVLFKTV